MDIHYESQITLIQGKWGTPATGRPLGPLRPQTPPGAGMPMPELLTDTAVEERLSL